MSTAILILVLVILLTYIALSIRGLFGSMPRPESQDYKSQIPTEWEDDTESTSSTSSEEEE